MDVVVVILGLILLVFEISWSGKIKKPTVIMFAMLSNFIFLHAWILVDWIFDTRTDVGDEAIFSIMISDIAFVTCLIFTRLTGRKNRDSDEMMQADGYELPTRILFVLGVGVSLYYLWAVGVSVFATDVEYMRHTNKKGYGYLLIFLVYAVPMCATYFYLDADKKSRWGFYICFMLTIALQVLTGFRAYLVTVLMAMYFIYCYRTRSFTVFSFIGLAVILCVVFVSITYYRLGTDIRAEAQNMQVLVDRVSSRIFTELPLQIDRLILIANTDGFLYGSTYIWDLQSAMPGPGESLGDKMLGWIDVKNELNGIAPLTPSIVGESYLNFGNLGVYFGSIVISIFCAYLDKRALNTKLDIVTNGFMAVFMVDAIIVGIGGSLSSRIGPYMFFFLMLFCIKLVTANMRITNRAQD